MPWPRKLGPPLYIVRSGIGDRNNRARENPVKRDELLDDLLKWMASVKAPLPTQTNAAYRPDEATPAPKGKRNRAQAQGEGGE